MLLGHVVAADLVGTGAQGLLGLLALGEGKDADVLARAMWQDNRAADHLVGVARVDAQADVGLRGRVETGRTDVCLSRSIASVGS